MEVKKDYDLFFYVCMSLSGLADLSQLSSWRQRCGIAVAYILETWSSEVVNRERTYLRFLDEFDYVFLHCLASIPQIQRFTRTPCFFLPFGTDCLAASPYPHPPARTIDVYSMGRRSPAVHGQLAAMAERGDIFYIYDVLRGGTVRNWSDCRTLTRNLIKRSRYFVAFDITVGSAYKAAQSAGENAIATRFFEGAAGGAAMIGSAPSCPEFREYFGWEDAVIEIPPEPKDMAAVLADLDRQEKRMERARRMNMVHSLRQHDWSYRWQQLLGKVGMEPLAKLKDRQLLLKEMADTIERFPG